MEIPSIIAPSHPQNLLSYPSFLFVDFLFLNFPIPQSLDLRSLRIPSIIIIVIIINNIDDSNFSPIPLLQSFLAISVTLPLFLPPFLWNPRPLFKESLSWTTLFAVFGFLQLLASRPTFPLPNLRFGDNGVVLQSRIEYISSIWELSSIDHF